MIRKMGDDMIVREYDEFIMQNRVKVNRYLNKVLCMMMTHTSMVRIESRCFFPPKFTV